MEGKTIYDYRKLKGKIKEVYDIQSEFAKALDISDTSLTNKLNSSTYFYQTEIDLACELLDIPVNEIGVYFFTKKVE